MVQISTLRAALLGLLTAGALTARAQSIGIGTAAPNPKAALDISSADKGLLMPRLTPAARRAIVAPPQGMLVFQTGNAATATDSVGMWYATGQGNRWLYLPDAQATATTAANGLTKTGTAVKLGGTLTDATTIAAGNESLTVTAWDSTLAGAPTVVLDQISGAVLTTRTPAAAGTAWQSFTALQDGALTAIEVWGRITPASLGGPLNTLQLYAEVYAGQGVGGQLLCAAGSGAITSPSAGNNEVLQVPLASTVPVRAGQVYTVRLVENSNPALGSFDWQYGGDFYPAGRAEVAPRDYFFRLLGGPLNTAPALRVSAAGVQLGGLAGAGNRVVTTDAAGTLSSAPLPTDTDAQILTLSGQNLSISGGNAITLPATTATASNGLTRTGTEVKLGGSLTAPTTVDAGSESLTLTSGGAAGGALDQTYTASGGSSGLATVAWQSFTVGLPGTLVRVRAGLTVAAPGTVVLDVRTGEGTSGTLLHTQTFTTTMTGAQSVFITLTTPVALAVGQKYTLTMAESSGSHQWLRNNATTDQYPGGRANTGALLDRDFSTFMLAPAAGLALQSGQVRLTGLSGPGLLNVAADGTVGTQAVPVDTDGQTLTLSGQNLSISGGNTIALPAAPADNLGNHAATQAVALNDNFLLLRAPGNVQNALAHSTTLNGPYLFGSGGGALGAFLSPNAVQWNAAGFVGIGGSAPDAARPLAVRGAGSTSQLLGLLDNTGARKWHYNLAGGGLNLAESGVADYRLFVQEGGRVGIGTGTPAASLHVAGLGSTLRVDGLEGVRPRLVSASADGTLTAAGLETANALDPPTGPAAAGSLAQVGPFTAVALSPNPVVGALALTPTELRRYILTNPAAPVLLNTVSLSGGERIVFDGFGNTAYVISGATLRVVAFTSSTMGLLGSLNLGAGPWEVVSQVGGSNLLLAGGPAGNQRFQVVNITSPQTPTLGVSSAPFLANEAVRAVVSNGSSTTPMAFVFTEPDTGSVGRLYSLAVGSGNLVRVMTTPGKTTAAVSHSPTGLLAVERTNGISFLRYYEHGGSAGATPIGGRTQISSGLVLTPALASSYPRAYVLNPTIAGVPARVFFFEALLRQAPRHIGRAFTDDAPVAVAANATLAVVVNGLNPGAVQTYLPTVTGGLLAQNPDGSTVSLPLTSFSDDLGSHTATQNLALNDFRLSNDGDDEGISIDNNGFIGLNTTATPDRAVTIRGTGSSSQLLGFRNAANARRFHWNLANNGLNLAETSVADFRLFVAPGAAGGGAVGINTGTPAQELHVVGAGRLDARGAALQLVAPNAGEHTFMEFYTSGIAGGRAGWLGYGIDGGVNLELVNQRNGSLLFRTNNATRLRLNADGNAEFSGDQRTFEFGANVAGKETNAGKIGYQAFTPGALDVVGAGTSGTNRQIKLWAEGGTTLTGGLTVAGLSGTGTRVLTTSAAGVVAAAPASAQLLNRLAGGGQIGTATVGANMAGGVKAVSVTFPTAFAAAPSQIICTIRTEAGQTWNDVFAVTVRGVTASTFIVNVTRTDQLSVSGGTATGANWGQNLTVDWVAVP